MKVGLFDPYLDTLGGGERYMMTIAEYLLAEGCHVDVFWDNSQVTKDLEKRFNLNLDGLNFVENIFRQHLDLLKKRKLCKNYDLIIYLSDGSIPSLFAKKNILHFQVPFTGVNGKNLPNKIKMTRICRIICNSGFTKRFIDREFGVKSDILYPPVAVEDFSPGKKENIILNVSRFSQTMQAKKQEVLIRAFRNIYQRFGRDWRLVLAGGEEDKKYLDQLRKLASDLNVEFLVNLPFADLKKIYGKAKIFWHAAGFGEDEERYPERMEHFGIVVAEAMAAGCVPVVIKKGGIPEIVADGKNGFLWETTEQLEDLTLRLVQSPTLCEKYSKAATKAVDKFSKKAFCQKLNEIIKG